MQHPASLRQWAGSTSCHINTHHLIVNCICILNNLMLLQVGMYATSRIVAAVGRQHILPPFLARVHPRWATPYVATISQGIASAVIALFTDFADLAGALVACGRPFLCHPCGCGECSHHGVALDMTVEGVVVLHMVCGVDGCAGPHPM